MRVALLLVSAILFCAIYGCVDTRPPDAKPSMTATPPSLAGVGRGLDVVIVLAIIAVGIGVGLFFALPASHKLSISIAATAGGIEASALIARVSLWFFPWLAGALGIVAVCLLGYEIWRNRKAIESDLSPGVLGRLSS